jgi:hypothetical protein
MKTLQLLSLSALALAGSSIFALGCGASTVDEAASPDASAADAARTDASADGGRADASLADAGIRDAAVRDAAPAIDASCTPGPSILDSGVPDAALPDGGNTGACAACIVAACPAEVAACDAECECNVAANELFTCLNSGQSVFACAQQGGVTASPALQNIGQCAFGATQCRTPCGVSF